MSVVFMFTNDHNAASQDQKTVQLIGIRLFNAAASGIKLALSGYYQPAFHQVRDILEIGFLLDFFRRWPQRIELWETSDRGVRRQHFDPVVIRKALDQDDGDESRGRETQYRKLSELASHLTPQGFVMTVRGTFAEFGPFVDAPRLLAWLHEAILRLGPSVVMYGNHFPEADAAMLHPFQEFGSELIRKYHSPIVKPQSAADQ